MTDAEYLLLFGVNRAKHIVNWERQRWYFSEMNNNHYIIEQKYFKPLFKTQREADKLDINTTILKYHVLICNESKASLRNNKSRVLKYIEDAEKDFDFHKRPSCSGNQPEWYCLGRDLFVGDFVFPSKIGEKFRLIDNRNPQVFIDKVNYNIKVKDEKYSDILFLILNGMLFRYFIDLFSRQLTGSQTLSDVDVNVVEKTLVISPSLLIDKQKELQAILKSLKSREQGTIYQEVKQEDRRKLDTIVFEALGLEAIDVDILYKEACKFVKDRSEKSDSVVTTKVKQKLNYEQTLKLIRDRFDEINTYSNLIKNSKIKIYTIPNLPAIYPLETKTGSSNLFASYPVYFTKDQNKKISLSFSNIQQVMLLRFLLEEIDAKGIQLSIPESEKDCQQILQIVQRDFRNSIMQLRSVLKSVRSSANTISHYIIV